MKFFQRQTLKDQFKLRLDNGLVVFFVAIRIRRELFQQGVSLGNVIIVIDHVHATEKSIESADVLIPEVRLRISTQGPELHARHGAQIRRLLMFHRQ